MAIVYWLLRIPRDYRLRRLQRVAAHSNGAMQITAMGPYVEVQYDPSRLPRHLERVQLYSDGRGLDFYQQPDGSVVWMYDRGVNPDDEPVRVVVPLELTKVQLRHGLPVTHAWLREPAEAELARHGNRDRR